MDLSGNHPRCECHDCTQARAREHSYLPQPAQQWNPNINPGFIIGGCNSPCCRPGYVGDCFCTHGRATTTFGKIS